MTTSEYEELSLAEKEKYWLANMAMKTNADALTKEQYEYEWEPAMLYEDDLLNIFKEYCHEVSIGRTDNESIGLSSEWEYFLEADLGEIIKEDCWRGKTIVDYMRAKGFPLTFVTWI